MNDLIRSDYMKLILRMNEDNVPEVFNMKVKEKE
jgi:hypothetical protein